MALTVSMDYQQAVLAMCALRTQAERFEKMTSSECLTPLLVEHAVETVEQSRKAAELLYDAIYPEGE